MNGRNDGGNATTTPKINDLIGLMRKDNRAALAARFLVQCFDVSPAKRRREIFIFEVLTATRTRSGRSFILCLCMKTIGAKQAKVHFANFCST